MKGKENGKREKEMEPDLGKEKEDRGKGRSGVD